MANESLTKMKTKEESIYRERFGISFSNRRYSAEKKKNFDEFLKQKPLKTKKVLPKSERAKGNDYLEEKISRTESLLNEVNDLELERIYNININEYEHIIPVFNFLKIGKCSILKYGIKKSKQPIKYSFCKTCDHNLVNPICISCINQCHKGHLIKYIFKKGKIRCFCGEKNHYQKTINNNIFKEKDIMCFCNEWNKVAKLGFYYNNSNQPICILCHNYCQKNNKQDKIIKLENNQTIPKCTCNNLEIHKSPKIICEKMINLIEGYNEFHILLHPIQFINMIFKSKNNFKLVFEDFEIFMKNLNIPEKATTKDYFANFYSIEITNTNIYRTLLIFEKIIQKKIKNNNLYFYNEEVIKYFSFDYIKKFFHILEQSSAEEKSFCILLNKYLYLFNQFYINYKTKSFIKFKINDLKNISFFHRIIIYDKNKINFIESEEIISFLLNILIHLIVNVISSSIESIECIKEIMAIFRKFSSYNLLKNEQMIKICINIIKILDFIRIIRHNLNNNTNYRNTGVLKSNYALKNFESILLNLYYIIMKMIMNFIYNYNDNNLKNIIFDKKIFPDLNSITSDNISFIYKKNELGKFINKINISILSSIQKYFLKDDNKKVFEIQRIGMEILQYFLNKEDDYILNINNSLNQINFCFQDNLDLLINNSKNYKEISRQCNLVSKAFFQYFNFEITIENLIETINNSLNVILGEQNDNIQILYDDKIPKKYNYNEAFAFISTSYIKLLSHVISIIYEYQSRIIVFNEKKKLNNVKLKLFIQNLSLNIEDKIIKKIIFFYFCFVSNSPDNSLLILSHSIFMELTKVPIKYCQLIFKLFYICIKNIFILEINENNENKIYNNPNIIPVKKNIIKNIYNYLEKIIDNNIIIPNNLINNLYYFLQILEITVFDSNTSLFNNNYVYTIQNILLSINKKFNLINQYFDMEANNLFDHNKSSSKSKNINHNELINKLIPNNDAKRLKFFEKNKFQKCFFIYLKLINNCFDFTIETDKNKIEEIINVDKIIYALQNNKIDLDLRTEFLRLLRKILLDIKYSDNDNNLYTNIIINNQDILKEIKNNPLK